MGESKNKAILREDKVSLKKKLDNKYGTDYNVQRQLYYDYGEHIKNSNQFRYASIDSIVDRFLNELPEDKKSIKKLEKQILRKAAKEYMRTIKKLEKENPNIHALTAHSKALKVVTERISGDLITSKGEAYEAVYLGSLLDSNIIINIWDKAHVNKYEVLYFAKEIFDKSKGNNKTIKLTQTKQKVVKKFQHQISESHLNNEYINAGYMDGNIILGLEEMIKKFSPTIAFPKYHKNVKTRKIVQTSIRVAATLALMFGFPNQDVSSSLNLNNHAIEIKKHNIFDRNELMENYITQIDTSGWEYIEERLKNIMLCKQAVDSLINEGLPVDHSEFLNRMLAVYFQESRFLHYEGDKIVKSPAGAKGIGQSMPETSNDINRFLKAFKRRDPRYANISEINTEIVYEKGDAAVIENARSVALLDQMLTDLFKDEKLALMSINWGIGNVNYMLEKYETDNYDTLITRYEQDTLKHQIINLEHNVDSIVYATLIPEYKLDSISSDSLKQVVTNYEPKDTIIKELIPNETLNYVIDITERKKANKNNSMIIKPEFIKIRKPLKLEEITTKPI